jgi:hypothetical protein
MVSRADTQVMPGYFRWQSPAQWFGVTLGSSIWLAISGAVLVARGRQLPGAVFLAAYALVAAAAWTAWARRATWPAYYAWQIWLATLGVVGLVTTAVTHATGSYGALNLDAGGLIFLYAGIGIGVPLLMADGHCREKSDGRRGAFGALFDFIAGWV